MNYPTTIYVGDSVTFTAVFDPADAHPESVDWELRFFVQTEGGGIPTTTSTVEASGSGETFGATLYHATIEPIPIGGPGQWYVVRAEAKCNDNISNAQADVGVTPYVLTAIDDSGSNNEGDSRTYVAITDPAEGAVGMFSWSRSRTSTWGSSDDTTMTGMGSEVQKDEVDPGVWEIDVSMESGGYTSSTTISVQIDPATVLSAHLVLNNFWFSGA